MRLRPCSACTFIVCTLLPYVDPPVADIVEWCGSDKARCNDTHQDSIRDFSHQAGGLKFLVIDFSADSASHFTHILVHTSKHRTNWKDIGFILGKFVCRKFNPSQSLAEANCHH